MTSVFLKFSTHPKIIERQFFFIFIIFLSISIS